MPIIGLTDRGLSFPEIGQIRKGVKETRQREDGTSYEVPVDLNYFRVEFDQKERETKDLFKRKYGEQPQDINIILPFDEIERCWDAWLEAYTAGRMVARSDGEKFIYLVDTETGKTKVKNGEPFTPYEDGKPVGKDYEGKPVFAYPVGRLKVIVPELARAAYMTVTTTSIHDIANISMQLEAFKQINRGVIKGIPLVLRRRPNKISIPNPKAKGKKIRVEKWLLSIEADPAWVRAKLIEVKSLALPTDVDLDQLLPGVEDAEVIEGELLPEDPDMSDMSEEQDPDSPKMSYETASRVETRQGKLYVEMESDQLMKVWGQLQEKINHIANTGEDIEHMDEIVFKRDAINVILAERHPALIQESED